MFSAKLPHLSTAEHVRLSMAKVLSVLATHVAARLIVGPGWLAIIAWGVAIVIIVVGIDVGIRRRGHRHGRPFVVRKHWNEAQRKAFRSSWMLPLTTGFSFGFCIGGTLRGDDWEKRFFTAIACAAMAVVFASPWERAETAKLRRD